MQFIKLFCRKALDVFSLIKFGFDGCFVSFLAFHELMECRWEFRLKSHWFFCSTL